MTQNQRALVAELGPEPRFLISQMSNVPHHCAKCFNAECCTTPRGSTTKPFLQMRQSEKKNTKDDRQQSLTNCLITQMYYTHGIFVHIFQALCCSCALYISTGIFCLARQNKIKKKRLKRAFSMSAASNGYTTQPRAGCLKHFYSYHANR